MFALVACIAGAVIFFIVPPIGKLLGWGLAAAGEPGLKRMLELLDSTSREIVDVKVVPDLLQVIALRARLEDLDGVPVININDVPLQGFNAWLKRASGLGAPITARLPHETRQGLFEGIDATGALLLKEGGQIRAIAAGEVFF